MRAIVLVVLATWIAGCSYVFVNPPHEADGGRVIGECTTNRAAPAVDTLLVTTNALSAIYVATGDFKNKRTAVGIGLGAAAFWLSSAIYGFYNTGRCSELLEDERPSSRPASNWGRPSAAWQLTPPPPPPAPPPAPPVKQRDDE